MAGDLSEDMLYWPAADSPPLDESLRRLRASDLMILLIAHKYGTPPPGLWQSITELEFDEAMRLNLPVLAFQVDPDQAWPPRFIENDKESRARLDQFVGKVRSKVVVSSFTTPDSLEVAITHAVMHYSGRRMSIAVPEFAVKRLHHVNRPESLFYSPEATVQVGNAPDGAPLLLAVKRRIELAEPMARIAQCVGRSADDELFSGIVSQIAQEARTYAAASGVLSASWNGRAIDVYVPRGSTIVALMAPNLFQSVLGADRDSAREQRGFHSESTSVSGLDFSDVRHEDVVSLGGGNRYLSIGLDGDQNVWTGGWSGSQSSRFFLSRPFIEEGLERLAGVRYVIKREKERSAYLPRPARFSTVLDTEIPYRFQERWVDLLSSCGDEELSRHVYEIQIPRISIVKFILEVVQEVGNLHERGVVHGDIKPSNTLANRNGTTLIDDVGLAVGDVSPTVTVGWSPYEQLLRQPLSCAADVFPLGQMLLHVLGGQLLGKEVTFLMPEGKRGTVIEDPTIYMPADGCIGSPLDRKNWCRFIETALKTDPARRWPTAGAMGEELCGLLDRGAIDGHVSINLPWGDRPALVHKGNGEIGMGWVMPYDEITRVW